jgi:hypothetical protein
VNGWMCPRCGCHDLDVQIVTWAKLSQTLELPLDMAVSDVNEFETLMGEGMLNDHEWDEMSPMACRECSYEGVVRDFAFTTPPEGCLGVPGGREI